MLPFKLSTKLFTLEIYRRGVVFTVASILLTAGVSLCNENILVALFSDQFFDTNCNNYSLFVGLFLILISLFLFYLLIINWRKEIYTKTFLEIRKAADSFGNSWRARLKFASTETLRDLHTKAYGGYRAALDFIRDNQTVLDVETYDKSWELLDLIGHEIIQLDVYIEALNEEIDRAFTFDPEKSNEEAAKEIKIINEKYREFVELIMRKERYRLQY